MFSPIILHAKWNTPNLTSNLNPEASNLINSTLTDYDYVSGRHAEGIIRTLHMNPSNSGRCKKLNHFLHLKNWSMHIYNKAV